MAGVQDCLSIRLLPLLFPFPETCVLLFLHLVSFCHPSRFSSSVSPPENHPDHHSKGPSLFSVLLWCPMHVPLSPIRPYDPQGQETGRVLTPLVLSRWLEHGGASANDFDLCYLSNPHFLIPKRWNFYQMPSVELYDSISQKPS